MGTATAASEATSLSACFPVAYGKGRSCPLMSRLWRTVPFVRAMLEHQACVDCGVAAPDTDTNYTLISGAGWRLTRQKLSGGRMSADWHCPRCWSERKGAASSEARLPARPPVAGDLSKTKPGF